MRVSLPNGLPPYLNYYTASDYATQEDEGDFTEHGCFGVDEQRHIWICDWFYGKVTTDVGIDELLAMAKRNHAIMGFGETGVIRHAINPAFLRRQQDLEFYYQMEYVPTAGGKTSRALAFQALAKSGFVHVPDCLWGERLIDLLCDFPGRKSDDAVDVCSIFARAYESITWAKVLAPPEEIDNVRFGSWKWLTMGTEEKADDGRPRRF